MDSIVLEGNVCKHGTPILLYCASCHQERMVVVDRREFEALARKVASMEAALMETAEAAQRGEWEAEDAEAMMAFNAGRGALREAQDQVLEVIDPLGDWAPQATREGDPRDPVD